MKDYIRQLVSGNKTGLPERGVVREYLQARILQSLQDSGAFLRWAFHGGTSLRFLYSMPRYSEDLDFALVGPKLPHDFTDRLYKVKNIFEGEDYAVSLKINDEKTVASAMVCFPGLLYELGLSPHDTEALSVKIELDTNPPAGAGTETSLIRRYVTLNILHHDKASLLAGKLHAVLSRGYTKGRDFYDLMWYLSDRTWPPPNLALLDAALSQTGWSGPKATKENWRELVAEKLNNVNWERAIDDVRPFLERQADLKLLARENLLCLLQDK